MKRMKKVLEVLLVMVMSVGFSVNAFAVEQKSDTAMPTENIIAQLNAIDFGKKITFSPLPQTRANNNELLKFDSVKEAEIYLKDLLATRTAVTAGEESLGQGQPIPETSLTRATSSNAGYYTNTVYWWGGGNTSLLSMTNADVRFYYNNGVASNISVTDSYMTGIVGASWTHRSGKATPLGGTNAKISVTGTWYIGIDIKGFTVGTSFNETLTCNKVSVW